MTREAWRRASVAAVILVLNGALVPHAGALCGDGVLDEGEECDGGNAYGGDGCAANCTRETLRHFNIDPRHSYIRAQLKDGLVRIPFSGTMDVYTGQTGANGLAPFVVRSTDFAETAIPVPPLVCACVRSLENPLFGPDNLATGILDCSGTVLDPPPPGLITFTQDHDTNDSDPTCNEGLPDPVHPGVCNGRRNYQESGVGPLGSVLIVNNLSLTLIPDGGSCSVDPSDAEHKGVDGKPCTPDDPIQAPGSNVPATTATIRAAVFDANDFPGDHIAMGEPCGLGDARCEVQAAGAPFDCSAVSGDPTGGLETGAVAFAFPLLDVPLDPLGDRTQDIVATVLLVARPACTGDCDNDGRVTIDEVVTGVRATGEPSVLASCPILDRNASTTTEVDEIVAAIGHALAGCP